MRGLNRPHKHGRVRKIVKQYALDLIVVLETRVKARKFYTIFQACFP